MCKCCDGNEYLYDDVESDTSIGANGQLRLAISKHTLCVTGYVGKDKCVFGMIERNVPIDFCPKCGTPLGEVKPLTVEQLREREGKPVWVQFFSKNFKGGKIESWAIVDTRFKSMEVCENSLKFCYYGTSWYCYDRKPKREAE